MRCGCAFIASRMEDAIAADSVWTRLSQYTLSRNVGRCLVFYLYRLIARTRTPPATMAMPSHSRYRRLLTQKDKSKTVTSTRLNLSTGATCEVTRFERPEIATLRLRLPAESAKSQARPERVRGFTHLPGTIQSAKHKNDDKGSTLPIELTPQGRFWQKLRQRCKNRG